MKINLDNLLNKKNFKIKYTLKAFKITDSMMTIKIKRRRMKKRNKSFQLKILMNMTLIIIKNNNKFIIPQKTNQIKDKIIK